jgi:hypothetical protein
MTSKKKNKAKQAESPKTKSAASSSPPSSPPAPENETATPPDADKLEASGGDTSSASSPADGEESDTSSASSSEASDTSPTEVLMGLLFEAWIAHRFAPAFHWMTRTFGHHRVGDKYDTNKIFDQLDRLGAGDHAALLEELEAFRDTCFSDLQARLAERKKKA